jgi:hypothetical protein
MTCTESTPNSTHSADCTGISLHPVPRLVPRPSRRPSLSTGNISAGFASRRAMPSVRPGVAPSARGRKHCGPSASGRWVSGPSASGRWVMSHTTHVSLVSCVPARLDDLPGRRTAVAGLACRLPRLAQSH